MPRGRDPETDDFLGPSRSQQRRDALEVLDLAHRLMDIPASQLAKLPLDDDLRALAMDSRRITAQIARKRQTQYLAKHLRKREDEALEALRRALANDREQARQETVALHRVERWRERLLEEGDEALAELLADHPDADRQSLRQLVRNAREERTKSRPPHAFRELFQRLKTLLGDAGSEAPGDEPPG
jgi:ribosome-associated protein